jgi:cell wall assembly regulator SMI1
MTHDEMWRKIEVVLDKEHGSGATADEISAAEGALSVQLPPSYKAFLSKFGWAKLFGDRVLGVGHDLPSGNELIKTTLGERSVFRPYIPHHLVPVMNDGAGNHYCLDTAQMGDGECPVVFWDHEHPDAEDQTPEFVAPSFAQWIITRIAESPHANEA